MSIFLYPSGGESLLMRVALIVQFLRRAVLLSGLATFLTPPSLAAAENTADSHRLSAPDSDRRLRESRIIKIIHSWPDDPEAQDALIRSLANQGFGGVVCNVSFSEYLKSEAKWKSFARAVEQAKKAGFSLWLYDEKGYPSAAAGGLVLQDRAEWEARGLLIADAEVENAVAELNLPPGTPKLVAAFPLQNGKISLPHRTNLTSFISGGKVSWRPPPGRWLAMAITEDRLYEGTHASMSLAEHLPYPDLLEPEPTARFLELTHEAYAARLGQNLGKYFVSTFTDEPSLMSLFLRPMPYRVLPWSTKFPEVFGRGHNYRIEDKLPALVADAGPETARVRFDYWNTIGTMVADNFLGQIQRWCRDHHVLSGGHLLMEENLVNQVALYGDFFACLRRLDAPGIDCLTSLPEQVPWYIARAAGSAADLEQRTITMCETSDHSQRYRPAGDKRSPQRVTAAQIRGTCNRLIVSGINTITSYYSFDGLSDEELRHLNEYLGRCCLAVKGGHQVAGIAVLYPTESLWVRFIPSRHYANDSPAAAQIESIFHDVSSGLFATGRDFTYVDARALAKAEVRQGALVHGDLRWDVVVLPGADTLPMKAWENLARFVATGGVLISIGAPPANSDTEFSADGVRELAHKMLGLAPLQGEYTSPHVHGNDSGGGGVFLPAGLASLLPLVLDSVLERDFRAVNRASALKHTHRLIAGRHVYFVINDSAEEWRGTVELCAEGSGEACDPETGQITSLADPKQVPLRLAPYGASILRFAKARTPARKKPGAKILPGFSLSEVRLVKPTIGRGEFVRDDLVELEKGAEVREPTTPAKSTGNAVAPKWRVTGSITKGQVDTFLFTMFPFPQPSTGLHDFHSLVLDTWVPEAQKTPTQLLVILREKSGADYIASTGRLMGNPGYERTWVPWTRFQHAGWSKDPNGRLDLDQIVELRIGWGGYLGTAGEKVEFSLGQPFLARTSFQ